MFPRSSSSHPAPRPSRRTFVKGLAIGGAAASVGLLRQPAAPWPPADFIRFGFGKPPGMVSQMKRL